MPAHRIDRLNEEMKRKLSELIRELKDPRIPPILSVTDVKVTNDLSYAKVYVSAVGQPIGEGIEGLKAAAGFLQRELASCLSIRKMPKLLFEEDTSIENGSRIMQLLKEIEKKDAAKGEADE